MKITKLLLTVGLSCVLAVETFAASWVVSPGQSLQSAIDNAAAGDNITVQSGSYPESITINKGLDIRAAGGLASFTGNLQITDPTLPVYLADLFFGSVGGVGITVTGVNADVRMDRCQLDEGGTFTMTDGKLYLYKCTFTGNAQFSGVDWTTQRTIFEDTTLTSDTLSTGRFIASEAENLNHEGGELTVFQSQVIRSNIDVSPASGKAWLAYSTLHFVDLKGAAEVVGNHFGRYWSEVQYENYDALNTVNRALLTLKNPGGTQVIRNNHFLGPAEMVFAETPRSGSSERSADGMIWCYPAIEFAHQSIFGTSRVFNNTIDNAIFGIYVRDQPGAVEVRGNYVRRIVGGSRINSDFTAGRSSSSPGESNYLGFDNWDGWIHSEGSLKNPITITFHARGPSSLISSGAAILCEHDQAIITNNGVNNTSLNETVGGIQSDNGTWTETYLETSDVASPDYFKLDPASPGVDAGLDHPLFTDLDGSRNDVGWYGGHSYDPTGRTTTKPVILSGEVTPLFIKRGSSATIEARAAVVAEP
jgi:hypothetical protein